MKSESAHLSRIRGLVRRNAQDAKDLASVDLAGGGDDGRRRTLSVRS